MTLPMLTSDWPTSSSAPAGHCLAWSLHVSGTASRAASPPAAEQAFRKALGNAQKLVTDFPAVPEYRHLLAVCHCDFGHLLKETARPQEAEKAFHEALHLYQGLVVEFPNMPVYAVLQQHANCDLSKLLLGEGRFQVAEKVQREGLAIQERLV